MGLFFFFFFSSRRRHTRSLRDWSSDVCSSDLGLRLNTHFHASKASEKKVHLVAESDCRTELLRRRTTHFYRPSPNFEQSPSGGQFFSHKQSRRRKIEPLASHGFLRFAAEWFFPVDEKICP